MRCRCGSERFSPLGLQEVPPQEDGSAGNPVWLVNCLGCGTTLACGKEEYEKIKAEQVIWE